MSIDKTCRQCGSEMKIVKKDSVVDSVYYYLKCDKCKKEVARSEE